MDPPSVHGLCQSSSDAFNNIVTFIQSLTKGQKGMDGQTDLLARSAGEKNLLLAKESSQMNNGIRNTRQGTT